MRGAFVQHRSRLHRWPSTEMERWRGGEVEIGAASLSISSFSSFAHGPFDETRLNAASPLLRFSAASTPPQRLLNAASPLLLFSASPLLRSSAPPLLRLLSAISSDPRD